MKSRIVTASLLATAALLTAGCSKDVVPAKTAAATPIRVTAAVEGPAAPMIRTNGILINKDEIRLSFKVGGVIKHLGVHEGDRVRKGQRLAEIERAEVNAQVEQSRQAFAKAQRDAERGERLFADKVISQEQLEDLRTQFKVAQAGLDATEFNSSFATIVAPRDGNVLRRLAEEREFVTPGAPVIVLGALDKGFVVRAGLADRDIVQVQIGDAAEVLLDALPGTTLAGRITEVASAANPASGMFDVEVALDAGSAPLKSGLVAKVVVTPASAKLQTRIYVPIAAIVEGAGRNAEVFVLEGDRARRREVTIAFIENDRAALVSGLTSGERVVSEGALYLEDGELVAVQDAEVKTLASTRTDNRT